MLFNPMEMAFPGFTLEGGCQRSCHHMSQHLLDMFSSTSPVVPFLRVKNFCDLALKFIFEGPLAQLKFEANRRRTVSISIAFVRFVD